MHGRSLSGCTARDQRSTGGIRACAPRVGGLTMAKDTSAPIASAGLSIADPLARLDELERQAEQGGGLDRIAKQHAAGKLTARERVELFCDPGSFVEYDKLVTHRSTAFRS